MLSVSRCPAVSYDTFSSVFRVLGIAIISRCLQTLSVFRVLALTGYEPRFLMKSPRATYYWHAPLFQRLALTLLVSFLRHGKA